jgi:hypothetical protein
MKVIGHSTVDNAQWSPPCKTMSFRDGWVDYEVMVHELTHVWQAQTGVNLALAKLRAGDGPEAYHYEPGFGLRFSDLNIEQQAMAVQHAFLASRGASTPFAPEAHAALLAGTPLEASPKPLKV